MHYTKMLAIKERARYNMFITVPHPHDRFFKEIFGKAENAREDLEVDDIIKIANEQAPERRSMVMTIAERLIEEGKEIGLKQGKIEVALYLLSENQDVEFVAKATNMSVEEIKKLMS